MPTELIVGAPKVGSVGGFDVVKLVNGQYVVRFNVLSDAANRTL